jgi:hypothetical protein
MTQAVPPEGQFVFLEAERDPDSTRWGFEVAYLPSQKRLGTWQSATGMELDVTQAIESSYLKGDRFDVEKNSIWGQMDHQPNGEKAITTSDNAETAGGIRVPSYLQAGGPRAKLLNMVNLQGAYLDAPEPYGDGVWHFTVGAIYRPVASPTSKTLTGDSKVPYVPRGTAPTDLLLGCAIFTFDTHDGTLSGFSSVPVVSTIWAAGIKYRVYTVPATVPDTRWQSALNKWDNR